MNSALYWYIIYHSLANRASFVRCALQDLLVLLQMVAPWWNAQHASVTVTVSGKSSATERREFATAHITPWYVYIVIIIHFE